jgi:hypothetical protein
MGPWYERGYAGGLVFRQNRAQDTLVQVVLVSVPQVVPAA